VARWRLGDAVLHAVVRTSASALRRPPRGPAAAHRAATMATSQRPRHQGAATSRRGPDRPARHHEASATNDLLHARGRVTRGSRARAAEPGAARPASKGATVAPRDLAAAERLAGPLRERDWRPRRGPTRLPPRPWPPSATTWLHAPARRGHARPRAAPTAAFHCRVTWPHRAHAGQGGPTRPRRARSWGAPPWRRRRLGAAWLLAAAAWG